MNGTAITNRLQHSFKIKDNNLYGSSYYWNFRTSSFKQVASLILRKVTWLIKFETLKCSEVKDLTFFPSAVGFAKTYITFLPSRASIRQIHSEYFNHCLTKQIEYFWKRQAKGIIYLASVLNINNIRCN
jgi:hypothetical protein